MFSIHTPYSHSDKVAPVIPRITPGANGPKSTTQKISSIQLAKKAIPDPTKNSTGHDIFTTDKSYDFEEFLRAEDVDSYMSTTFRLTIDQCLKEGFELTGPNTKLVGQLESNLLHIMESSTVSLDEFVRDLVTGVTKFSNAMAIIVRRKPLVNSPFKRYTRRGRSLNPIAGLFYVEPQHMAPVIEKGRIVKWRFNKDNTFGYTSYGAYKEFPASDVFHAKFNRKGSHVFGTPWTLPALEDIRLLRRLEEYSQMLVTRHLFPLYHYKLGTERNPAQVSEEGYSEVDKAKNTIGDIPSQGVIFSSERVEIIAIDHHSSVSDLEKDIQHYDKRALTSAGLSDIDVGRGGTSNRGTATVLNKTRTDRCTSIQGVIASAFFDQILHGMILELGLNPYDPKNKVRLNFATSDTDERRSKEMHTLQLFQNGLITHDEARQELGRKAFTSPSEWENVYQNTIGLIGAEQGEQVAAKAQEQKDKALTSNSTSPENQTGKKVKPSTPKNAK